MSYEIGRINRPSGFLPYFFNLPVERRGDRQGADLFDLHRNQEAAVFADCRSRAPRQPEILSREPLSADAVGPAYGLRC